MTTENDIIDKINKKLLKINTETNRSVILVKFNWIGYRKSKITLKDLNTGDTEEISYRHFIEKGWSSKTQKKLNISRSNTKITKDIAIINIQNKIKELNKNPEIDLEFLGFKDNWTIANNTKLIIKCKIHDYLCYPTYSKFMRKDKYCCPKCKKNNVRINKISAQKAVDIKFKNDPRNYDYSLVSETFKDYKSSVTLVCPVHGKFEITYATLISKDHYCGIVSCPECQTNLLRFKSKQEETCLNIVRNYIDENLISQYNKIINIYNNLYPSTRNYFRPDIYIPSINAIIEYDGIQHYNYTKKFHTTQQDFINQVNRDRCLERYCKENNIRLLRIPWKDNNRLEEVIKTFLVDEKDITTKVEPKLLPAVIIK